MCARRSIDFGAEVRDVHARAVAGLEQSSLFALLGECLGKLPPDLKLPPSNIPMRFGGLKPLDGVPPRDLVRFEIRDEFAEYCARYAVVGMITTCEVYLQGLLFIARLGQEASQRSGSLNRRNV